MMTMEDACRLVATTLQLEGDMEQNVKDMISDVPTGPELAIAGLTVVASVEQDKLLTACEALSVIGRYHGFVDFADDMDNVVGQYTPKPTETA